MIDDAAPGYPIIVARDQHFARSEHADGNAREHVDSNNPQFESHGGLSNEAHGNLFEDSPFTK
ncbi:hypothetical protein DCC62_29800 [candidate division KSB1 bacterium]|nr:MAG: hypothetical protein DCC62_29800 [candidate division KSB1 bacterium]